ncbi:protein ubiquitination [Microsporum audouinii]
MQREYEIPPPIGLLHNIFPSTINQRMFQSPVALLTLIDGNKPDTTRPLLDRLTPHFGESGSELTPCLRRTCKRGMWGIAQRLVELGSDVNYSYGTVDGKWPTVPAAWKGHTKTPQYFLGHGLDIHEGRGPFQALWAAAWCGHADIARALLDAGMQLDHWSVEESPQKGLWCTRSQ